MIQHPSPKHQTSTSTIPSYRSVFLADKKNLGPGERRHISLRNDERERQTDFGAGQKCEQPVHYSSHLSDSIPPIYHRWRNSGRHNSRKKVKKGLPPKKVPFMIANPIDSPQKQGMHARKASTIREPSGERRRPPPPYFRQG